LQFKTQWGKHVTANLPTIASHNYKTTFHFQPRLKKQAAIMDWDRFSRGPTRLRRARSCGEGLGCEHCSGLGCKSPAKNSVSSKLTLATGQDLSSVPILARKQKQ